MKNLNLSSLLGLVITSTAFAGAHQTSIVNYTNRAMDYEISYGDKFIKNETANVHVRACGLDYVFCPGYQVFSIDRSSYVRFDNVDSVHPVFEVYQIEPGKNYIFKQERNGPVQLNEVSVEE